MARQTKSKLLKLLVFSGACVGILYGLVGFSSPTETQETKAELKIQTQLEKRLELAHNITNHVRANHLPEKSKVTLDKVEMEGQIKYTIDPDLQKEAERLLKSYKPDYGAIFMMDAVSGEVLAMASFQRDDDNAPNWNLQASFPAASVFKVVTATAAVDKAGISPEDKIHYNGGAYTLYKKNVMSDKVTRWTNVISLKNAFARSINTAFGRLSIENLAPEDLNEYASRFMFNQEIPADFGVDMGVAYVPPGKGFEMAEAASGYNNSNRMSPVQGAMIAAAVANDGQLVIPYMVESVANDKGDVVYEGETLSRGTIMTTESAKKVRELMGQTVTAGTSRRSFRPIMKDRKYRELEMGGKTGHLTGDKPRGRTDWFVGYAMDEDRKVSIAAVTVSKKFWTVKSAHLGQSMFMKYFKPIAQDSKSKKDHMVTSR